MVRPIDAVIRDRIAPVLRGAGFTRKGRWFRHETTSGDSAQVFVHPFKLGVHDAEFLVDLFVLPRIWQDFTSRDGSSPDAGLWQDRLLVPHQQPPMADHWSFDLSDDAAGELLSRTLSARLPGLLELLDPETLLAYARTLPHAGRRITVRPAVTVAALLAPLGPSDELAQRLELLSQDRGDGWWEFDTQFVEFVRHWLTGHSSTT